MTTPRDPTIPSGGNVEVKRLLLVEGETEFGFFEALLAANRRGSVAVLSLGGKSGLSAKVRAKVQAPGYENLDWLGIAIDGDDDPLGQFQSASSAISSLFVRKFEAPTRAWMRSPKTNDRGSASILILPDGALTGDLERYFWELALDQYPAAGCVEALIGCLRGCSIDKTADWKARSNSLLHALRPTHEKSSMKPRRNGQQMFELVSSKSHDLILNLIPADNETI